MALQLAERGFFAKEMNVGWKEWTYNRHPTHQGKADHDDFRCSCSKGGQTYSLFQNWVQGIE